MGTVTTFLARYTARAMSGAHPWGLLETTVPVRYGWRSFRLMVYPPGVSAAQRCVFWLDRNVPIVAAILVLAAMLVLVPVVPPLALLLLIPVGVAIIAGVRRLTKPLRLTVRILSVAQLDIHGSTRTYGNDCLMNRCVDELGGMDRARRAGQITPVEYERRWGGALMRGS